MTDRPEEHADVRRLLAEARHTEPMPDEVASRMDDVLAGLARSTPAREVPEATVIPLATRRRRRTAGALVAAAAVVVGAVLLVPHGSPTHPDADTNSAAARSRAAGSENSMPGGDDHRSPSNGVAPPALPSPLTAGGRLVVRPRHFSADARAIQLRLVRKGALASDVPRSTRCVDVPPGDQSLAARYRDAPAALVFRKPRAGLQVVDLYACGTARPLRSATLPAR